MRIIAGQNRGLKLATPRGREVRPILDRVRESLFGILRDAVPGARVADLFAGTGVIGLEALSRGAVFCLFVERDLPCISTIRENVSRARDQARSRIIRGDAFRVADLLRETGPADLVFVDPPYRMLRSPRNFEKVLDLLAQIAEPGILADEGLVVLRFPSDVALPGHVGPMTQVDARRYGGMKIAFFRRTPAAPTPPS